MSELCERDVTRVRCAPCRLSRRAFECRVRRRGLACQTPDRGLPNSASLDDFSSSPSGPPAKRARAPLEHESDAALRVLIEREKGLLALTEATTSPIVSATLSSIWSSRILLAVMCLLLALHRMRQVLLTQLRNY